MSSQPSSITSTSYHRRKSVSASITSHQLQRLTPTRSYPTPYTSSAKDYRQRSREFTADFERHARTPFLVDRSKCSYGRDLKSHETKQFGHTTRNSPSPRERTIETSNFKFYPSIKCLESSGGHLSKNRKGLYFNSNAQHKHGAVSDKVELKPKTASKDSHYNVKKETIQKETTLNIQQGKKEISSNSKWTLSKNKASKTVTGKQRKDATAIETQRNGEKSRAEDEAEHKSTNNSCRSTETKQVKTKKFKEPRAKPDISNVTNLSSPQTLKRSNREASTRPDETILSNTADHVSKFCRLSNYSDFLRAPFSTLKKSIANKNRNSTVTNETKKTEIVKVTENHEANIDYSNSDIVIQRSKTVPVKDTNITLRTHCQSPQQQKLEEYLSWEQKQKEKRRRLERYLAHMQVDEESCDNQNAPEHRGFFRVNSPLYFTYRSPPHRRKPYATEDRPTGNIERKVFTPQNMRNSETQVEVSSNLKQKVLAEANLELQQVPSPPKQPKEILPREMIEAQGAFNTIKNYCRNLIRISAGNPAAAKDDPIKNRISVNFFAKPIVDRPICLP